MENKQFYYSSGALIEKGDTIIVIDKRGMVAEIFTRQTQRAKDFGCFDTGGLLLKFESGDLQVWPNVDEDLILLKKGVNPTRQS